MTEPILVVRSKSENDLPPNLLPLAERFRDADKYFDVSLAEIERRLDADDGEYECRTEVEVISDDGEPIAAEVRLNINSKATIWDNWSVSIKLHRMRIDCIDCERRFPIGKDQFGSGWHRHSWDGKLGHSENHQQGKVPLPGFTEHCKNRASLLLWAFKELGVSLNKYDHGTDQLSFD